MISYVRHLERLTAEQPDRPAVRCGDEMITRAELCRRGRVVAHDLAARGVGIGDFVSIALPNSVAWFECWIGSWWLGAVPQPVSAGLPARELAGIVELARPRVAFGVEPAVLEHIDPEVRAAIEPLPAGYRSPDVPDPIGLPDVVSPAWKAPTSGGSTGRPKLIVSGDPALIDPDAPPPFNLRRDGCLVMPGPLHHNGPALFSWLALLAGNEVVLLERFDADATLAAIDRHRADAVYLVPTMMKRILRLPEPVRRNHDLSSLHVVRHLAEPCPVWLKEAWIDWIGPDKIWESYGGTEAQAYTEIDGVDWLAHKGSVGKVASGEMMIRDQDGTPLPAGTPGEIWMRPDRDAPTYHYVGASPRCLEGGWESLGDVGWFDDEGYLYLGDRLQDMILVGGANVFPAEVEGALLEHPAVQSAVVVGVPDCDRGRSVHAIVQAEPAEIGEEELLGFLAERIARYKLPRSFEYVDQPLRDDAGKVRRAAFSTPGRRTSCSI